MALLISREAVVVITLADVEGASVTRCEITTASPVANLAIDPWTAPPRGDLEAAAEVVVEGAATTVVRKVTL